MMRVGGEAREGDGVGGGVRYFSVQYFFVLFLSFTRISEK